MLNVKPAPAIFGPYPSAHFTPVVTAAEHPSVHRAVIQET
jgi:hypothetical protein